MQHFTPAPQAHTFRCGERVIYSAEKHSTHPTPRAKEVRPERAGDGYVYYVDKFWIVAEVRDRQIVLATRRGKTRLVDVDDPLLHAATWIERLIYRHRFPKPHEIGPQGTLPT